MGVAAAAALLVICNLYNVLIEIVILLACGVSQRTKAKEQCESREQPGRNENEKFDEPTVTRPSSQFTAGDVDETIERTVCWDLNQRGDAGETALHLCLLLANKQPKFRDVALALLNAFPKLSLDYYEGDEYYGRIITTIQINAYYLTTMLVK